MSQRNRIIVLLYLDVRAFEKGLSGEDDRSHLTDEFKQFYTHIVG